VVRLKTVGRQSYDLDVTLHEIGLTARDFGKFGGADRSEVIGMREEDGLGITPLMSVDQGEQGH